MTSTNRIFSTRNCVFASTLFFLAFSDPHASANALALLPDFDQVITPAEQRSLDAEKAARKGRLPSFEGVSPGVDLRGRDTPVDRQVGKSCTAFGLVAALENALDSQGKISLSERHFWSLYGQYSASVAVQTALANKITDDEYWPISQSQPNPGYENAARTQLTSATELGGDIAKAVAALDWGHAVYIAMRVPADMHSCKTRIPPDSQATRGGHALAVVGYHLDASSESGGGEFILKNSWGKGCGEHGYQYLPFHICQRSDMYCKFWEIGSVSRQ
jgi:C1A family cysteine protease